MTASAIIGGILGIIKAIPIVNDWFNKLIATYLASQTGATAAAILDAAALGARAQSDADRYTAAAEWQKALSRPRVSA